MRRARHSKRGGWCRSRRYGFAEPLPRRQYTRLFQIIVTPVSRNAPEFRLSIWATPILQSRAYCRDTPSPDRTHVPNMKNAASEDSSPGKSTTVLVADHHELMRNGIKMLVVGILGDVHFLEAGDGDSLFHVLRSSPGASLGLVDLNMPGMQGGCRLAELARLHPKIPLVVVSALSSPEEVRRTMNIATVYAFVPKSASTGNMRSAIEAALQGRKLLLAQLGHNSAQPAAGLTPRQQEIRSLLRHGMSNKAIAGTLGISEGTVKNHITEIFRVLHATNRTQAAQFDLETE